MMYRNHPAFRHKKSTRPTARRLIFLVELNGTAAGQLHNCRGGPDNRNYLICRHVPHILYFFALTNNPSLLCIMPGITGIIAWDCPETATGYMSKK